MCVLVCSFAVHVGGEHIYYIIEPLAWKWLAGNRRSTTSPTSSQPRSRARPLAAKFVLFIWFNYRRIGDPLRIARRATHTIILFVYPCGPMSRRCMWEKFKVNFFNDNTRPACNSSAFAGNARRWGGVEDEMHAPHQSSCGTCIVFILNSVYIVGLLKWNEILYFT